MFGQPDDEEQALLAETLKRPRATLSRRERIAEGAVGVGFLVAVALIWVIAPPGVISAAPALACLPGLVFAMRVRIDTPFGFTVPTQLAFVPLLFALPVALVPLAVVAATVLARVPDILRGDVRPSRVVQAVGNSWYAIGPVAVFAVARIQPAHAAIGLLLAALAAQFVVDFAISGSRFAFSRGASLAEQIRESWVYVVDAALSVVALPVAEQIQHSPLYALTSLPMVGLVALFARERHQRLQSLLELNDNYRLARDEAIEASAMKSAFLAQHEPRDPHADERRDRHERPAARHATSTRSSANTPSRSPAPASTCCAIIDDILDIAKIETGKVELDYADFDLHDTIEQACVPAQLEANAKGLAVDLEISTDLPRRVRGDAARVRQVLMNLVSNAVKFTHDGSVTVTRRQIEPLSRWRPLRGR